MKEYTYEELLALTDLNDFEPEEVYGILGIIFDTADDQKDVAALKKGLSFAEKQDLQHFSRYDNAVFHYYVGNAWGYVNKLAKPVNTSEYWQFENEAVENEIINLRKALMYTDVENDKVLRCQILTNLGNVFSHLGRFVEAIDYWKRALDIIPGFPMALGNLGFGLFHYAKVLYDENHRFIFCNAAHKHLVQAIKSQNVYEQAKLTFQEAVDIIEGRYGKQNLASEIGFDAYTLGRSGKEKNYRQWCMDNSLFINPINDFISDNVVAHDCLYLPTITMALDQQPVYHTMYNQLKQEFVSSRYLFYEGAIEMDVHFSDKGNLQMDTFDYSLYSLNVEKIKIAFRVCYSLFDKIGYFLNHYLSLGIHYKKVSFRSVWFKDGNINKQRNLNSFITETQNWPLRGLYWLSKDLYEDKQSEFAKSVLPEAKEIATIRNYIEHKSFKVVDYGESGVVDDELTYQISRADLEKKTITIMQMARSALIYLSLAIHLEELKKEKGVTVPMTFFELREVDKY